MIELVGNGFTTSDAKTGKRISANVRFFGGGDLNARFATEGDGPTIPGLPPPDQGFAYTVCGKGRGRMVISAPGYKTLDFETDFPVASNIDYPMEPTGAAPSGLHLEVRGNDFVDASGQPACYSGVDQFIAFRMWLDRRKADLEALITESREFGFQWWRIFFQGSKAQNTIFDLSPTEPLYYAEVRPFAEWLNARGIGLLAEIYVDNQDVQSPLAHWSQMADLLRGTTTILSGGNEWPKNGFDPQALPNPHMIWSRGSSLADELTPQNGATCASFHQRTDMPTMLRDTVASAVEMELRGYTVIMMDEPTRWNLDGSNKSNVADSVRLADQCGAVYDAFWDFRCFHNQAGQRGILMPPPLRACAVAWAGGLRA